MPSNITRRRVLQSVPATAAMCAASCDGTAAYGSAPENVYLNLGVRPAINAWGTVTIMGGCIMPAEVVDAMTTASRSFVPLPELQLKAGQHIAKAIGVPAAMISCGAASAITCGTAACVTGGEDRNLRALPDTTGMRNEIIQQRSHRSGYEAQMLLVGTTIIWVETREELEDAINERTAMMFFLNKADPHGRISRDEWIEVAQAHGIPTMNDAAADVPPVERLRLYVDEGFDMVIFSGGKGLLGPQASGLLLGRPDLVEAARKAISPHSGIGRGMKVGKEEIIGLVAAVDRYLALDHEAERRELDQRAATLLDMLKGLPAVVCVKEVPEIHNRVPHVTVSWNEDEQSLTANDAKQRLIEGDPPIGLARLGEGQLRISTWMLRPGEDAIVGERVRALFTESRS